MKVVNFEGAVRNYRARRVPKLYIYDVPYTVEFPIPHPGGWEVRGVVGIIVCGFPKLDI